MGPENNNQNAGEFDLAGLDAAIGTASDTTRPAEPPKETPPPANASTPDPEPVIQPAAAEPNTDPALAAAIDGTETPVGAPAPAPAPAAKAGEPELVDPATLVPGTAEHAAAVAAKEKHDAEVAARAAENTPEAIAERERVAAVDKEADSLGIKGKARDRFHALNREVNAAKPFMDALAAENIKDVDTLRAYVEGAYAAGDMVDMVKSTGADVEQYTFALDYLTLNNAADRGDEGARKQCLEWIRDEYVRHATALGVAVPGVFDPLDAHPDLKEDLENGDISRERALELAGQRTRTKVAADRQAAGTAAREQQQAAERAQTEAIDRGKASLNTYGQALAKGPDAARYATLKPKLIDELKVITTKFPPEQWAAVAAIAWEKIKAANPPAAAAPTRAPVRSEGPVRSAGPQPHLDPGGFDDPMKALEAGIDAADKGY